MEAAPGPRFTRRDAWVVVAIALVLIPILIVVVRANSEASRRIRCADNLKQIGLATLLYSNENRGEYPRVRYELAKVVTPVWGTGTTSPDPLRRPRTARRDGCDVPVAADAGHHSQSLRLPEHQGRARCVRRRHAHREEPFKLHELSRTTGFMDRQAPNSRWRRT